MQGSLGILPDPDDVGTHAPCKISKAGVNALRKMAGEATSCGNYPISASRRVAPA